MTAHRFSSGKEAMNFLTGRTPAPKKSGAQLDAEIADALARKPRQTRSGTAKPRESSARSGGSGRSGSMTPAQFIASLPPPHSRRGPNSVGTSVIAKTIKAEVASAVSAGALPAGTKVSASTDHNSINVDVTGWSGAVFSDTYGEHLMDPTGTPWDRDEQEYHRRGGSGEGDYHSRRAWDPKLTNDLNRAMETITKIADRHNYNNSDSQSDYFDVGYYLYVGARPVVRVAETGIKRESNKEFASLMEQAHAASQAIGPAATKSICGSKDLASADKHCLEKMIKLAKKADGRPVIHDTRGGWMPDDGSAAKVANLPEITLGKTKHRVVSGGVSEGYMFLMGPRGGSSHLVRATPNKREKEQGVLSTHWAHNHDGKTTWFIRANDGTFSYS